MAVSVVLLMGAIAAMIVGVFRGVIPLLARADGRQAHVPRGAVVGAVVNVADGRLQPNLESYIDLHARFTSAACL